MMGQSRKPTTTTLVNVIVRQRSGVQHLWPTAMPLCLIAVKKVLTRRFTDGFAGLGRWFRVLVAAYGSGHADGRRHR
ncbi:hypothetical protein ABH37_06135 [Mycobacterium haemophilum]|uniref:Uncharacterized protein n=1 Tax=Mycobacterium haemophilum TaxID=29311 RepID=A0A0I9V1D4_9MYCO|nr:hypothetical protein ABH39_14150 [Mycobacterium haemophilum]KLO37452.1 hypothetical protein ABH38_08610 [Mycobacterium haemophilum]KLO44001.1 hypothetical protein ABH37_06135 [Mycobacterium haemophilum]KLO49281.1 hypothetical protein ABH36_13000 [Mycobacterium haemophilum]